MRAFNQFQDCSSLVSTKRIWNTKTMLKLYYHHCTPLTMILRFSHYISQFGISLPVNQYSSGGTYNFSIVSVFSICFVLTKKNSLGTYWTALVKPLKKFPDTKGAGVQPLNMPLNVSFAYSISDVVLCVCLFCPIGNYRGTWCCDSLQ